MIILRARTVDLPHFTFLRGRVALAAMLRGLGVSRGDRVAIQAFTCVAVPEAVLATGAQPVYVDTIPGGFTMDPAGLAAVMAPDVKAAVIQHTFGEPADLPALLALTGRHDVPVLEDCAHSVASTFDGRVIGSFGAGAFYSYEASKPVFAGIGGAARINDPALRSALERAWREYRPPSAAMQLQVLTLYLAGLVAYWPATYWTVRTLYRAAVRAGLLRGNYNAVQADTGPADDFRRRMGGLQRRVLARALGRVERQTAHRVRVAGQYRAAITAGGVIHPPVRRGVQPVYGRYPVLVPDKPRALAAARAGYVELADFYTTPVHGLAGDDLRAVGYVPGSCPSAEAVCRRVVSLPTAPAVGARAVARAARVLASAA